MKTEKTHPLKYWMQKVCPYAWISQFSSGISNICVEMLSANNKWAMHLIFMHLVLKALNFFSTSLISAFKFIWNENKLYFLPRTPWDETEPNPANYSKTPSFACSVYDNLDHESYFTVLFRKQYHYVTKNDSYQVLTSVWLVVTDDDNWQTDK